MEIIKNNMKFSDLKYGDVFIWERMNVWLLKC